MRSLSKFNFSKFELFKKKRKAQFFILTTFAIVSILYFISRWIEPYTIIDTSSVALHEEPFIFNNIVEKAVQVIYNTAENSDELKYNLEEYKAFVESYALHKNIDLDFDMSNVVFGDPTTGYIDVSLLSPDVNINKRLTVDRSFAVVGWWRLDEGKGSIASDYSGNGNRGDLMDGPLWIPGILGNALEFDGLNDRINIPDSEPLKYKGGDMSIEAWIYTNPGDGNGRIVSKPWNGMGWYNYRLESASNNQIILYVRGEGGLKSITGSVLSENRWYHVVGVLGSDNTMKLYIDGVLYASGSHSITSWVPTEEHYGDANRPLCIASLYPYGSGWVGNTEFSYNGRVDEVRIWSASLSPEQIRAQFLAS